MTDDILFGVENNIATLTLNRPQARNAFSDAMLHGWADALRECQRRDDIKVVVLNANGKTFCAGGDIKTMLWGEDSGANPGLEMKRYLVENVYPVAHAVEALEKPYLVAVQGAATGAGMDMALYGDMRFASESARFAETYVKVGMAPGDGGGWLLPRLVGINRALELLWTGDFVSAQEALAIGLVNHVVPDEELMDYTYAFAKRLAAGPSIAINLIKRTVYQSTQLSLRDALETVSSHMGVLAGTADHREAVNAFMEKRPPTFVGK